MRDADDLLRERAGPVLPAEKAGKMEWVRIAGLALDATGVLVIASGALLSKERAVEIGVPRYAGESLEENLQLPTVRALLAESRRTFWGLLLIALGFGLQIVGKLAHLASRAESGRSHDF